ncbi:DNA-directed RNA polymerase I [Coprinopsis marcescibilis]|uniref:DNA-directed RNA polymerases I, II, and III subunit RPABC1 n=1 Tax=Coprinopsis marcescibilis TaxID=230819 RepID=A0A5C3L2C1_COPMA|nr:DNA-directed RNA polymerase I [Coprinopsis marcescibilis]
MADSDAAAKLWKVRRTVCEMVKDRGYLVSDDEINMSLEQFRANYETGLGTIDRSQICFPCTLATDPSQQIYIMFVEERSVVIKTARKFTDILSDRGMTRGILIYPGVLTPSAKKHIYDPKFAHVEAFAEAELLVNVTHHTLVPRHQVLSPEEKKTLLDRYRLKETQLPRIQPTDAVARYFGLRRGQVVKIIRPSETSGRYASYRICF